MVSFVRHDLDFILQQILIAEANATKEGADGQPVAGTPLSELISDPHLPWGLRTVDGKNNNIIPGREDWGSADQPFPRLLDEEYRDDQDGDSIDINGPAPGGVLTQGNYGQGGNVVDADPRTISNLVVDQTLNNPAAIVAALKYAELTGEITHEQALSSVAQIQAYADDVNAALQAIKSAGPAIATAQAAVVTAQAAVTAAQAANPDATATLAAYSASIAATAPALTAAQQAASAAATLVSVLEVGTVDAEEIAALAQVSAALAQLVATANAIRDALDNGPNAVQEDLDAIDGLVGFAGLLQGQLALVNPAGGFSAGEISIANNLVGSAQSAILTVQDLQTQLQASEDSVEVNNPALAQALANLAAAQDALTAAQGQTAAAQQVIADTQTALEEFGVELTDNGSLVIPNIAPDEGVSAPFNSWMTLFGQFFDHGLDLVTKGGNGTVFIPLEPDDPLYVEGGSSNFMVLTRATPDANGQHTNTTTPFVDQNQTYTSHASHQVFLREYAMDANGRPMATGDLLEGDNGGLATWLDVKEQASQMLGIQLTDGDVSNVPLLATDEYGRFLRGADGFAQVVVRTAGADGVAGNADDQFNLVQGDPTANGGLGLTMADIAQLGGGTVVRTGHAFLDDIAHNAVPVVVNGQLVADADDVAGNAVGLNPQTGRNTEYDDELLDRHFVAGDGRANENIGLTAVHHVFHSEHNRLVEHTKDVVLESGDIDFINQWLKTDIAALPADLSTLDWDGERLFQAARFGTEMQYQHLVFEEFARKVNPAVDLFVFNPTMDVDPAIFAEFAHVVYRFGHSMLSETVDRLDADGQTSSDIGLIEAFLNPLEFDAAGIGADVAAGAIIRGMTRQTGNEIDEFVTDALRNNLLGLPLDLATINMARARDTGIPSLNHAREQFYEMTHNEWLKPYTSWVDFAQNLKNPASIINFIASYGTHASIAGADTLDEKRDAATLLVLGGADAPADRLDFLNGLGAYANGLGGLNDVDLWIGGLAESILPFGGMLGSTFTFVFEAQMENLQNGDRLYYLSRTQGLNFLTELEANSFASLVKLNTDLGEAGSTHLPGELFGSVDYILEVNQAVQEDFDPSDATTKDPGHDDPVLDALQPKVFRASNVTYDGNVYANELKFTGDEHVVLGGTDGNDLLIADLGDDTLWGDGGDDVLVGGHGINRLHGGAGDDIIFDGGDPSFIHGEEGNDVISGGSGLGELIFAGSGHDFVVGGIDGKEVFAAEGNDFILGSPDVDFLLGGMGDDWIEGGEGFDTLAGDNSELFFNSTIIGHDVMFAGTNENDFDAESGDDIMVQGESVMRNEGMLGFDWATFQDMPRDAYADMRIPIFTTVEADILRNRFDHVEALSGWDKNDTLIGDDRVQGEGVFDPGVPPAEGNFDGDGLTREGVERIVGLADVLRLTPAQLASFAADAIVYDDGNILLGGGGSDFIEGRAGDDIIDGDKWLRVRIGINDANGNEIGTTDRMQGVVTMYNTSSPLHGKTLDSLMFTRQLNPSQLSIEREILDGDAANTGVDIARFSGASTEYTITENADGTFTVDHTGAGLNGGAVDDGTDNLRNVEVLQFSDTTIIIGDGIDNGRPTGTFAVTDVNGGAAGVGETFRVTIESILAGVADPDGLPTALSAYTIVWQYEETLGAGDWVAIEDPLSEAPITGAQFIPTSAMELEGLRIRAVLQFRDNEGIPEAVASQPVGPLAAQAVLAATPLDDVLFGTVANDVIDGQAGDDDIFGFAGNDTLTGGLGDDLIDGGEGTDTAVFAGASTNFTFEITPEGTIEVVNDTTLEEDEVVSIENFQFADTTLTLAQVNALLGIGGGLDGTAGNDVLTGTAGADVIDGAGGNDTITGGDGADALSGGAGVDTIDGGAGADQIAGDGGVDVLSGGAGQDTIDGGAGADQIAGNAGNDTLNGDAGADTIEGGAGNDTIDGGAGADLLFGDAGNDTIFGGDGADEITGGAGNDELTGSAGVDMFIFGPNSGADTITDFDDVGGGQDLIDLTAFTLLTNFNQLAITQVGADAVITSAAFAGASITVENIAAGNLTAEDFNL